MLLYWLRGSLKIYVSVVITILHRCILVLCFLKIYTIIVIKILNLYGVFYIGEKKRVNILWVDMEQTPVPVLWPLILYVKLDPGTDCLPIKDYLEIILSSIKEKLYLGHHRCMNTPYSMVSQAVVCRNHGLKTSPFSTLEGTHFFTSS